VGGIGIIRLSGPDCSHIGHELTGRQLKPREATPTGFYGQSGDTLDYGVAIVFKAPASYTGEDVLELYCHGGPVVMDRVLAEVTALGADLARPGEFTERAFLNGKMDLTQAEAVADLINSQTEIAARSALKSLEGDFSREIFDLSSDLGDVRVLIEANIDFSEELVQDIENRQIKKKIEEFKVLIEDLIDRSKSGELLSTGAEVVLVGAPNAGKSSLLNALARADRAIVTATPGTTRDLLEATISLEGLAIRLIDTAGLRKTDDEIEAEGMRRAIGATERADLVLEVRDDSQFDSEDLDTAGNNFCEKRRLVVYNKCDLSGRAFGEAPESDGIPAVAISATTRQGIDVLERALQEQLGYQGAREDTIMARRRHIEAMQLANSHLLQAAVYFESLDLLAEELRLAQKELGKITGETTTEDLLGDIFSTFCIGK
jgi:tRNA modification GTPase